MRAPIRGALRQLIRQVRRTSPFGVRIKRNNFEIGSAPTSRRTPPFEISIALEPRSLRFKDNKSRPTKIDPFVLASADFFQLSHR